MAAVTAEAFATLAETVTTADPLAGGTSLAVSNRSLFPQSGQFRILVQDSILSANNRELMLVTAGMGAGAGSFTVTRGIEGTTGVAHPSGSYVAGVLTAEAKRRWVPEYVRQPRHHKAVLWNGDPLLAGAAAAPVTLVPILSKVWVPETVTITNVAVNNGVTAGATLVSGSNRVGVYDSTGTLLSQSATIAAWPANTVVTTALGAAQTITGGLGVFVWLAVLVAASTLPTLRGFANTGQANWGLVAADNFNFGTLAAVASGSGLPASFAPGSALTAAAGALPWLGAS